MYHTVGKDKITATVHAEFQTLLLCTVHAPFRTYETSILLDEQVSNEIPANGMSLNNIA